MPCPDYHLFGNSRGGRRGKQKTKTNDRGMDERRCRKKSTHPVASLLGEAAFANVTNESYTAPNSRRNPMQAMSAYLNCDGK